MALTIDIYCRPSLGSGGSGTSGDPYGTVAAAYSAASNGEVIGIDTTTGAYAPTAQVQDTKGVGVTPWVGDEVLIDATSLSSTYVWRLEHTNSQMDGVEIYNVASGKYGIRINADIDTFQNVFIRDCDGDAILHSSGAYTANNIKIARCRIGYYFAGGTGVVNVYDLFTYDMTLYNRINAASATINLYRNISGGHIGPNWFIQNGTVNFYEPTLIGGAKNAAADNIDRDGGTVTIHSGRATYPVLDSGSFTKGFPSVTIDSSVVGPDGDGGKFFATPRRSEACIAFVRDDLEDYVTGGSHAGEYDDWLDELESRGFKGTYALSTQEGVNPDAISDDGWRDIIRVVERGHEIATHGRTGYHIHNDDWLDIQYTGSASVCRLVISGSTLTTYEDAVEDLSITLEATGYRLDNLVTAINADANYTCTKVTTDSGTSDAGAAPAHLLADVDIADIKASAQTLSQDTTRAAAWEIGECKWDIASKTGHIPIAHVYSAGSYNSAFATWMASNGFVGARLGAAPNSPYSSNVYKFINEAGYDAFQNFGILGSSFLDTSSETTLKRSAKALCEWAMFEGAQVVIYAHDFTELSAAQWGYIFDVVSESGIDVCTLGAMFSSRSVMTPASSVTDDAWSNTLYAAPATTPTGTAGTSFSPPQQTQENIKQQRQEMGISAKGTPALTEKQKEVPIKKWMQKRRSDMKKPKWMR